MAKQIIGALIGGLILFLWSFLSWAALNLHGNEMSYTENQEKILTVLNENLEAGDYFLPSFPQNTSPELQQKAMMDNVGKPWARISYRKRMNDGGTMNMVRGFAVSSLAIFLLIWILGKIDNLDFLTILLSSVFVGLIGYLTISYANSIWFETNTLVALLDAVVSFGLVGLFLSWWLRR